MKFIPVAEPLFSGNEIKYVTDCIRSSWVSTGKYVDLFEKKFAKFCGVKYATTTTSGTTALHSIILALNIKKGDEVLVPNLTYVSSANAVAYSGAKPIFVDVDRDIWAIDPTVIEARITKKTKAIMVVHLYGHPADMDVINAIAKKHNLFVIEDACQVHGALYKGKKTGALSDIAAFSFSGAKTITTGEGGMVISNNKTLMQRVDDIKTNYTSKKRDFFHTDIGYNFRFTNIQAAIGVAQLEKIKSHIERKIENARIYNSFLKDEELLQLPIQKPWALNTYWLYSVVLKKRGIRDNLASYLRNKNIETRQFFVPMHKLPMYKQKGKFPNTDFLSENGISFPSGLTLTPQEVEYACSHIKKFLKTHA